MAKKISKQVKKAKETKIVKKVEKKSPKPVPAKKKQVKNNFILDCES